LVLKGFLENVFGFGRTITRFFDLEIFYEEYITLTKMSANINVISKGES
jgi:hypothetical protein